MAIDILKGSAATPLLFLMVQTSDHITALTGASPTVKIGKNGGTGAAPSGAVTEVDATNLPGLYKVAGNATDTNTAGPIWLHATAASGDPTDIMVANIIDPTVAVYGANTVQLNAQTVTAAAGVTFPSSVASPTNITAGTITTVTTVTGLTASNLDATISSRMATYTQPTGFLAATFPTGTVANTTNITAGTITTATNLTNAPTAGDFTATMKTSIGTAVAASAVASVTGNVGGSVASVLTGGLIDLTTTTYGEPSGPVGATATLKDMLVWMKVLSRNLVTQTATTETVFKDDGTTVISTSTDSDNGVTLSRGRWS